MRSEIGISRPKLGLVAFGLFTFVVGFLGQGSWGIGARAGPTAVSVVVTDVSGGAGNRRPVQVQITLAVSNQGADEVRVLEPAAAGLGTRVLTLSPSTLVVRPGAIGQIEADVTLECDSGQPLQLPDLQLELVDGLRRPITITGSGLVLEACSRAVGEVRPLAVRLSPKPAGGATDRQLSVVLNSPTHRRLDITAIRSGGVALLTPAQPVTVAGSASVVVQLTAPPTCPGAWQITGVPSSLSVDLSPDSDAGATLRLRIGPPLTRWLLNAACPRSR